MTFRIILQGINNIIIPFQYHHMMQGLLYSCIENQSKDLAEFLHETGYQYEKRTFKMFTFSEIIEKPIGVMKKEKQLVYDNEISFYVSTIDNQLVNIICKLMEEQQVVRLGKNRLFIKNIQILQYEIEEEMKVRTASPICCYSTGLVNDKKRTIYYHPYENEWKNIICENIRKKCETYYGRPKEEFEFSIQCIDKPIEINIFYKGIYMKTYKGKFHIKGSKEAIEVAFNAGIGSKNAQGFGLVIPII